MATLIIIDRPKNLNIPYFAMGSRLSFENWAAPLDLDAKLAKIVGRRCTDWVRDRQGGGAIRLLETRNYLPPKTAVYVNWLSFHEKSLADDFLNVFPRYRLEQWAKNCDVSAKIWRKR